MNHMTAQRAPLYEARHQLFVSYVKERLEQTDRPGERAAFAPVFDYCAAALRCPETGEHPALQGRGNNDYQGDCQSDYQYSPSDFAFSSDGSAGTCISKTRIDCVISQASRHPNIGAKPIEAERGVPAKRMPIDAISFVVADDKMLLLRLLVSKCCEDLDAFIRAKNKLIVITALLDKPGRPNSGWLGEHAVPLSLNIESAPDYLPVTYTIEQEFYCRFPVAGGQRAGQDGVVAVYRMG
jgi:hypothetical protein